MSDIKLDRKREFSLVYGDPHVRFVQDGHSYRADGTIFARAGEEPPIPPPGVSTPSTPVETKPQEIEGLQDILDRQRNQQRSDAMKRIWQARKNAKESGK